MSVVCVYGLGLTLCLSPNVQGSFKCKKCKSILGWVKQCKEVVNRKRDAKKC